MQDWKEKSLSQVGKEVLLKAVIQSIPSYAMNCFLFPSTLCQEIEKETARFFWGSTIEDRKCHWANLDVLTTPKAKGGIGFRELHYFNIAMLAKQFWNLIQHPNSMAARILKAKYCRRRELITAHIGYKPSYLWRSLMAARELVLHGMAWRVGDGKNISIRDDRWIGVQNPSKTESIIIDEFQDRKVSMLINAETGCWDVEMIEQLFQPTEAIKIYSIPLSRNPPEDRRLWRFDKHGRFTVKSAYHAAVQLYSLANRRRASASVESTGWQKLWDIKALPRVKMFVWKACTNALPTRDNLARRGCIDDPICGICGDGAESIDHLLLRCQQSAMAWYGCPLRICMSQAGITSFKEMILDGCAKTPPEYKSLVAYMAWEIWNQRNAKYFENKQFVFTDIIRRAEERWREDMDSKKVEKTIVQKPTATVRWIKPDQGKYKLNSDVAVMQGGKVGLGFVIRDHNGEVNLAGKCEVQAAGSTTLLEGLAIRYGLQMALQYHLQVDQFECDNKGLVDCIMAKTTSPAYCDVIISDIRVLMNEVGCTKTKHIPRATTS